MEAHKQRHAALFAGDGYVPRIGADLAQHGAGFADVAADFIPLIVIAALTLPLAAWLFRNRLA